MKIKEMFIPIIFLLLCCSFLLIKEPTGKVIDINSMLQKNEYSGLKEFYNENIQDVPGIVKTIFGNERINVYIFMDDKSERLIGVIMKDGIIDDVKANGLGDPTMNAYLSEETVNKLVNNELNAVDALNNGDITYKSLTVKTGIKMKVASLGSKLFGWLS